MWYKNVGTSFFRSVTTHALDRRTDRQQTDGQTNEQKGLRNTMRCITCSRTVVTYLLTYLLVPAILHRFRDTADDWDQFRSRQGGASL